jgi:EmrB/QacA subfamily drug resistance transporter
VAGVNGRKTGNIPDHQLAERAAAQPAAPAADRGKWLVLIAIGASTFMTALDTSVVNTVLPVIQTGFATDIATIQWVVTIYLLVVSGLLLSFGRLGDLRGHKTVFLAGFAIFIGSSALCGVATSAGMLIAARGLQALGAAMLAANSPAILTKNFPAAQRGQALGLQATMTYLGLTAAPSFGGWLAGLTSWRAVFYINVPVGLIAGLLAWRFIPPDRPVDRPEPFDLPGAVLFMAGLVALLLGLNQGYAWGWTSPAILGLLSGSILTLAVFIWVELHKSSPMLDLSLFREQVFSASVASAVFNYIAVYSIIFLTPFYLIQGRGLTPAQAGVIFTALPIVMALVAPLSGTLSDRAGVQLPSVLGMGTLALGLFFLSRLGFNSPFSTVAFSLAVAGFGTGAFISPNNSALMGSAPRQRQGIAAGILATARSVGMVLGVGISGAIFTTMLARSASPEPLYAATRFSFLAAAGFALLGMLASAVRGKKEAS